MKAEPQPKPVQLVDPHSGGYLAVRSLSAEINVDGPLCQTTLRVTFANDLDRTLEGDLVFPLPPSAALSQLKVVVGGRTLNGKLRPRQRAQAEYRRARDAGHTAAISESEGEDLGRLRVAPIEKGEDVEVTLTLIHTLPATADGHRLLVPLTYMPRYVEDDAALKPTERAALERPRPLTLAARASVEIFLRHGQAAPEIRCHSHKAEITPMGNRTLVRVTGVPLDRDLHLSIRDRPPAGATPEIWVRHDPSDGPDGQGPITAVALTPPAFADEGATVPRTVTLLVDRSGSMEGEPMAAAIRAVRGVLRALGPADRFNIVAFDTSLEALSRRPVPFDQAHLQRADAFINQIGARGGTEASMAMQAALQDTQSGASVVIEDAPPLSAEHRLRLVVFMTDGDVAGAEGVLQRAQEQLVDTRLHVIGIGESVQHALLGQLATIGGGTYTPVARGEDLEEALNALKSAMDAPLLTGVRAHLQREGARRAPKMQEPPGPLDLFAGQPLLLSFRGPVQEGEELILSGQRPDGTDLEIVLTLSLAERSPSDPGRLWALLRNRRLTYRFNAEDNPTLEALGVAFGLVNRQVALVAVHDEKREVEVEGTVAVSLPLPANVASAGHGAHSTLAGGYGAASKTLSGMAPPPSVARPAPMPMMQMSMPVQAPSPGPMAGPTAGAPPPAEPMAMADDYMMEELAKEAEAMPALSLGAVMPRSAPGAAPSQGAPPPSPRKHKKGGLLQRVKDLFSADKADAEEFDDAEPTPMQEAAAAAAPPPPPSQPPPAQPSKPMPKPSAPARASAKKVSASGGPTPVVASSEAQAEVAAPVGALTGDAAGLRALLLHQGADGLFGADVGATLAAVAGLVKHGHTGREGLFRAELRRTVQVLRQRLGSLSGDERVWAALALALLLMPHGEAAPAELPEDLRAALEGLSLSELPAAGGRIAAALRAAPAGWQRHALAAEIARAFAL